MCQPKLKGDLEGATKRVVADTDELARFLHSVVAGAARRLLTSRLVACELLVGWLVFFWDPPVFWGVKGKSKGH